MASPSLQQALEAQERKDHLAALPLFQQALADEPGSWIGYTGLGNSLRALGRLDDAITACTRAVEMGGGLPQPWAQLGFAYQAKGRLAEARLCLEHCSKLDPGNPDAHNNLAVVALHAEHFDQAEAAARRALAVEPRHVRAVVNLGRALKEQGRLDDAVTAYRRALSIDPGSSDAGWNLGLTLLMQERWAEGWPLYELRSAIPGSPLGVAAAPLWDGRPLQGATLLVQAEKGLGDTLQFARYLRLLKTDAGAGRVVLECQPPLQQLMAGCAGVDVVVPRGGPLPRFDARVPMMSLPLRLRAFDPAASAVDHYLTAEPARVARWRQELAASNGGRRPAVGIAWQGNPAYQTDHRRSVPLSAWVPFLRQAQARGVAIYSLQKGHGSEQVAGLPAELGVHDLARGMDEGPGAGGAFVDTAAVIAGLDLVISSDTAIPHLGGALGTPTWMLLSHLPDWRWGHQGRACPWYPRLRLFRQPQAGDWGAVFEALCAALPEIERTHA